MLSSQFLQFQSLASSDLKLFCLLSISLSTIALEKTLFMLKMCLSRLQRNYFTSVCPRSKTENLSSAHRIRSPSAFLWRAKWYFFLGIRIRISSENHTGTFTEKQIISSRFSKYNIDKRVIRGVCTIRFYEKRIFF